MIGPSSGTANEVTDGQYRAMPTKRKVFDDLDIDNFCEEVCQTNRKRYLQELETPVELLKSSEIISNAALFSPMSAQEAGEESSVARLEVLLVDGTNCTWTTLTDLEQQQQQQQQQQNLELMMSSSSSSSLSSSSSSSTVSLIPSCTEHVREHAIQETYILGDTNYQPTVPVNYWESVVAPVTSVSASGVQLNKDTTSNNHCQQQQFEDQENGNLSWLLDFKLDSFIEAADDKSTVGPVTIRDNHIGNRSKPNGRSHTPNYINDVRKGHGNDEGSSMYRQDSNRTTCSANVIDNRNLSSAQSIGPKKPPFTYTELIEHALQERGELTVSAIYQWISEHFPYYKSNDDRWKNSVRHNLSINPHFRKGSKAPHGAGHLWAIANRNDCKPRPLINGLAIPMRQVLKNECNESRKNENIVSEIIAMDEVEAATASITQQNIEEETNDILNTVTLEHSAEQILNGIKREVEVQYLVPMIVTNNDHHANQQSQQPTELQCPFKESDFLNPVSKEVVAEECGLISEGYLVTDLSSNTLGFNMVDPEIIGSENLFGEELSFQFYELTSPSQLQSA